MKLSKSLLSAIVIGIAVQTVACKKEKDPTDPRIKLEAKKTDSNKNNTGYPENCPACGMG
jgi:hypothetical protein